MRRAWSGSRDLKTWEERFKAALGRMRSAWRMDQKGRSMDPKTREVGEDARNLYSKRWEGGFEDANAGFKFSTVGRVSREAVEASVEVGEIRRNRTSDMHRQGILQRCRCDNICILYQNTFWTVKITFTAKDSARRPHKYPLSASIHCFKVSWSPTDARWKPRIV
jgi:hypothetical protein